MIKNKRNVYWTVFLYTAVILFILFLFSGRLVEYQARILPDYAPVDLKEVLDRAAVRADAVYLQEREQGRQQGGQQEGQQGRLQERQQERQQGRLPGSTGGGNLGEAAGREPDFLFTEEEYDLLYHQTGLGRGGVKAALLEDDPQAVFLEQQENFFKDQEYRCFRDSFISRREQTTDENGKVIRAGKIIGLEDGDIIVTKSSRAFGWRNGHAGLVVDAEKKETLEAIVIGENTALRHTQKWEKYPNFLVLRLAGAEASERKQIAEWAKKNLLDVPYRLTAGFFGERKKGMAVTPVTGTQCAHLIWRAYKEFGCDLDENGGWIVTPRQLANSPLLEVVQVYGMDPDRLWK